ncbi:MAG: sulfite exporter TauE/SafE family protein, partial [Verrucomicrobiota bacterium]
MTLDTQSLTIVGALAGGVVTSLHCMAMCGPLACGMMAFQRDTRARLVAGASYHCSRLLSYSLVGGICGGIGASPLSWFFDSPMQLFPWAVGLLLLAFALCGGKLKLQIPWLTRFIYFVRSRLGPRQRSPLAAGLALGFTAPLLPCGPLYILFGACLFSGSFVNGLTFGLAFGLGTVPALWVAHQSL